MESGHDGSKCDFGRSAGNRPERRRGSGHGGDLGATIFDAASIAAHAAALAAIGAALAPDGQIQLYACDVACGAVGRRFIADLSAASGGVDVAAATRPVGAAALGGSWALEASTGAPARATAPFTAEAMAGYAGILAAQTSIFE